MHIFPNNFRNAIEDELFLFFVPNETGFLWKKWDKYIKKKFNTYINKSRKNFQIYEK